MVGASFRGVPFFVDSADRLGGRRVVTHEFPLRDDPYIEDLGRRARVFTVEGYVLGDGYLAQRDALLDALEDVAGPGELVHPYHGVRRAVCSSLTTRDSISDGGMARFSIEFTEAPAQALTPGAIDLQEKLEESASASLAASTAELEDGYDVAGMPAFALESAAHAVEAVATELGSLLAPIVRSTQELARLDVEVASIVSQASTLIRDPGEVIEAFAGVLGALAETVANSPGEVLRALVDTYAVDVGTLAVATTATRAAERANQDALLAALRRLLAIQAAQLASRVQFSTHDEAVAVRDEISDLLEEQEAVAGDASYPTLVQLRADLARAVPGDAVLARLVSVERQVSTPSILLSYQLYGSIDQEADLVARNEARHPGFMVGTLKALSAV